jgi:hypothetical protein
VEERAGLVARAARVEAAVECDEVEKIAMFTGGGVGPFAGGAYARVRSVETDEQTAAGCVPRVADEPVAAFTATVREIVAAHRLGLARETVCQIGSQR